MLLIIVLLFAVGAGILFTGFVSYTKRKTMSAGTKTFINIVRDTGLAAQDGTLIDIKGDEGGIVANVARMIETRNTGEESSQDGLLGWLDKQLEFAGRPRGMSAAEALAYVLVVWAVAAFVMLLIILSGIVNPMLAGIAVVIIAIYPYIRLRAMKRKRQDRARMELPVFLNDLILSLSSGMSTLDEALSRTVRSAGPGTERVLVREFGRAYAEYRHGSRDRESALRDAADRIGVDGVNDLVDTIINALRTGAPIREALRSQSNHVQIIHKQELEAYIAKKEPAFIASLVIIMFGALLLMVAPMAIQLKGLN